MFAQVIRFHNLHKNFLFSFRLLLLVVEIGTETVDVVEKWIGVGQAAEESRKVRIARETQVRDGGGDRRQN